MLMKSGDQNTLILPARIRFVCLILIEHLKLRLMNNMKLATEPCVHCSFYIVKSIAQLKLEILDYKIFELTYFYILNYLSIISLDNKGIFYTGMLKLSLKLK